MLAKLDHKQSHYPLVFSKIASVNSLSYAIHGPHLVTSLVVE